MYVLKQSPRAWYAKMDSFLLSQNFERYKCGCNVYMQQKGDRLLLIALYVGDFLITSGSTVGLMDIKSTLSKELSMTYLGLLR